MRTEYNPKNLTAARMEVKKRHPKLNEVTDYQADTAFLNQIRIWSSMSKEDIEAEAAVVSIHQVKKLALYIPENILRVSARNLIRIVYLRATEPIVQALFTRWQDFYFNKDLSFLLYQLCKDKKQLVEGIFLNCSLTDAKFMQWLQSKDIPYTVGTACAAMEGERVSFQDRMRRFHISPNSKLGQSCSERFLTFCTRADYLDYSDQEMRAVLEKYNRSSIRMFVRNILTQLEVPDFQRYYFSGCFLRDHHTGRADSREYQQFFREFPPEHELKFRRWQNYILVKESFTANSEDERLKFWSQYVPYSINAYRNAVSESLVMEFEWYTIVEFTTETMGPLYVYRKDVFERYIKNYVKSKDNQELRHLLYTDLSGYSEKRIVHNDNWQWKTGRYLTAHSIIH